MARTDASEETAGPAAPEETHSLVGQEDAEAEIVGALRSGRLHHAWLMSGPRGIGKATLAFRFARFLLRYGHDAAALRNASSLDVPPDDPIALQIAKGTTQDLLVLRRGVDEKTGKEKTEITVDVTARLQPFFNFSAGRGGWRVVVIDPVDDLNRNAGNALLKALEEPPQRAILLLVSNAPGRVLATIRSRCRKLVLRPLGSELIRAEMARQASALGLEPISAEDEALIAKLADGSIGRALELLVSGGLAQARALEHALSSWPNITEREIQSLLGAALIRGRSDAFASLGRLMVDTLRGAARGAAAPAEGQAERAIAHLARGAPAWAWADLATEIEGLFARALAINLDERAVTGEALRRIANICRRGDLSAA
jgi:DNA polymerase-3 subunit delta'